MIAGLALERPDSPRASFALGKFTIVRKFLVVTTSVLDGPGTVVLAPGLPLLFEPYFFGFEFLPTVRCRSVEPERLAPNSLEWEVTCTYESPDYKEGAGIGGGATDPKSERGGDGGGSGEETDGQFFTPELMIPEVECHFETHKEVIYGVYDPANQQITPATASNGEIFIPAPERDRSHLILTITRNESIATPHPALALQYQDTVNADVFWGANPGQAKCQSITAVRQTKNFPDGSVYPYLKVTYIFHFKDTWNIVLLDKGTWYWYKPNGTMDQSQWKKKKFQTDDNQNTDGLLDGTGGALPIGGTPSWRTLQVYPAAVFGNLGLPQNFASVQ